METDKPEFDIRLITYGVKYDRIPKADLYFDCQVFTDPSCFHKLNGQHELVQNFLNLKIGSDSVQRKAYNNITKVIFAIAQMHESERKAGLKTEPMLVALFCFGGRHRSVGVSEMVKHLLEESGITVELTHLDMLRRKEFKNGFKQIRAAHHGKEHQKI